MATTKEIKINYYWPLEKSSTKEVIIPLERFMRSLADMEPSERVVNTDDGENIELKEIEFKDDKWIMCFLKNKSDSIFKSRLGEKTSSAEPLDVDEFIGYECVVIYDCQTKLLAIQNNRNSIGAKGVSYFFDKKLKIKITMSVLKYDERHNDIQDNDKVECKTLSLSFTDLSKLERLDSEEDDNIRKINELVRNFGAIGGKLELSVGRKKDTFLDKISLKSLVTTIRGFNGNKSLKMKVIQDDTIRTIDLISDKVSSTGNIVVSKEDPKTFTKIIKTMEEQFEMALTNELQYCKIISNIMKI